MRGICRPVPTKNSIGMEDHPMGVPSRSPARDSRALKRSVRHLDEKLQPDVAQSGTTASATGPKVAPRETVRRRDARSGDASHRGAGREHLCPTRGPPLVINGYGLRMIAKELRDPF